MKNIDPDLLNLLLEHKAFPKLCALMKNYFRGTVSNGIMARDQLIDFATEPLAEIIKDMSFLNSTKIQSNEADIEKIKNILMKILRNIKEDMKSQQLTGAVATTETVRGILAALPTVPISAVYHARNSDTAQYTSSNAIIVLTTFACLENSHLNTEPNADQHRVNAKPMNASNKAKPISGNI